MSILSRLPVALASVALLALTACFATSGASSHAIPLVRVHAEADLDCPGRDIRIVERLGGRFDAIGCGHKASYLTACEGVACVVNDAGQAVPWRGRPDPTPTP